ncbi:MAG: type VI secretion system baseplate subunit TssF [Leptothrix sp. (in: Bacteria)]|nr:type VI secretion system baseplate subunit TssF [Leptothrix sp. (in: b-proteobacteria)]
MDPRLLRYYNEELRHLREMGGEFAQQFPKIAARLGMEGLEVTDPYVERLLEGFAFLAGRIQLKLDAEFPRFTQRLLEIVYPQFLAPTPAMLIAQFHPDLGDPGLAGGLKIARGSSMSSPSGRAGATVCEFRTAHDLTMWPLELTQVEYFSHAADLPMAAVPEWRRYRSGLRLRINTTAGLKFSQLALQDLRVHCAGIDDVAYRLHELVCGHAMGVLVLPTRRPAAWHEALGGDIVEPAGFDDSEALLPVTLQGLQGYRLLQEYFAFAQRFLFFDLCGIGEALRAHAETEVDIVILFSRPDNALLQAVDASSMALHCVPAINLLEKRCDRIQVNPASAEFHVVPDRARPMDYEVHSVLEVLGYGTGVNSEWRFLPFYSAFHTEDRGHQAYFAVQREPRLMSQLQQREGPRTSYIGTELYLSVVDADEAPFPAELRQLGVRALCTNRDLPLLMPVGSPQGDLTLAQTAPVKLISVIKGPSRPQSALRDGSVAWKLINQLSLNHLSLTDTDAEQGAAALRQILRLYAQPGDAGAQRQVDGLRSVRLQQVVRRLPMPGPITFGRGVEVRVEVDDLSFEGASAFLLGCVLERFIARHVSINGFTQLRMHSPGRGDIFTGRPRCGARPIA